MQLQNATQLTNSSWQQEFRSALRKQSEINSFFNQETSLDIPFDIVLPKKFAQKIKDDGPDSPRWKQFLPHDLELDHTGLTDPIGDKVNLKDSGIIHRYQNRILYTPTQNCPVICRYCFRKNELSHEGEIFKTNLTKLTQYLNSNPEVNEVILTGGDPLMLSNAKLDKILETLSSLNIKYVRFHTRTPIILPSRIDNGFISLINKYATLFKRINFVLHTNHQDEIDAEVLIALNLLRKCPIKKLTQTVLLKGVNDNSQDLIQLCERIIEADFTPYYLHHPDKVRGGMHFYLPLEEGRKIYAKLRSKLPGWAIPTYIIDNYNGLGKQLAFNPESITYSGKMLDINGTLSPY